jgi:hypothetical protein
MSKYISTKKAVSVTISLLLVILPIAPVLATTQYSWQNTSTNPQDLVCESLSRVGMPCGNAPAATYQPHSTLFNFFGSNQSSAAVIGPVKDIEGDDINLVSVPGSSEIYELKSGRKHLFPTPNIFTDYGYTLDMVQPISQAQLDRYPLANLLMVHSDKKSVYYFTEGGMTRLMPNDIKVFDSYGDRPEDIISISRKEFNFYPVNQYVFLETPLNRDVFQLTNSGKRYLTPMAVKRLHIFEGQVAPINQIELDWYKTLAPVIN